MSKESYFRQPPHQQTHFSEVPRADIERSRFDRSHGYKTTLDEASLVPVYLDEILPGDTFDMSATSFCRMATPLKPLMDNLYLDLHFFFVPNRLVWDNWQKFMGEQINPTEDISVLRLPVTSINTATIPPYSLANYFGIPKTETAGVGQVQALPFRAYVLIYNEWYRDQNLQSWYPISTGDGPDLAWDTFATLKRGKRHDYFTSALPYPQKGDPVYVPLGTDAPILPTSLGAAPQFFTSANPTPLELQAAQISTSNAIGYTGTAQTTGERTLRWGATGLMADLTSATAITINDLRTAFQIQKLLERDARGGTRYIELLLSHFGVQSPDLRATRPVYLGGGTTNFNINPVASTAGTVDAPQGNLAATANSLGKAGFHHSFTEHGHVMGIASIRADLNYQQGVERFWSRRTRYDFYWPALAHLGEQKIYNFEIYLSGTASDLGTFGYQERNAEYRYKPSRITGLFQSNQATSLDVWHLAQDFANLPVLNWEFITEAPPISRVIAVPGEVHFLLDMWFDLKCTRPMPVYSVPGLIDHF